jgi:hypothetical protein
MGKWTGNTRIDRDDITVTEYKHVENEPDVAFDDAVEPEPARKSAAKVRRLVVLRGSCTAEVSGPPVMEIR